MIRFSACHDLRRKERKGRTEKEIAPHPTSHVSTVQLQNVDFVQVHALVSVKAYKIESSVEQNQWKTKVDTFYRATGNLKKIIN
jgi:menaquinone-dependent protoporphyrinogen IX oxidase